jgi:hypothetical protein
MRKLAEYPGQYNALAVCYFSAIDDDGVLDRVYNKVVSAWQVA